MKKYNELVIKKANEVINLHLAAGSSPEDARIAAAVTISYTLSTGVYPGYRSINQKVLNYLESLKDENK